MKDFITKIYEYPNFPIYLGSVIFILIIAFFVVFFLGKKDQKKMEKTQRLEKIKDDAFKEISTSVSPEITATKVADEKVQDKDLESEEKPVEEQIPISEPSVDIDNSVNDMSNDSEPYEEPVIAPPVFVSPLEEVQNNEANEMVGEDISIEKEDWQDNFSNDLLKNEVSDYDSEHFNDLANFIANELNELEKQQEIAKPILNENTKPAIIPSIISENDYDDEYKKDDSIFESEKKSKIVNDVFSSVYVPKKEEPLIEDTMAIELPKLKNEPILKDEETKLNIK